MSDRPNVLKHPYGTYLMVRPEFVLLRDDDIQARIMRIIEGWMEYQKMTWQAAYYAAVNAKQPPPSEPTEYWVTISQSQFIAQLYMFDANKVNRDEDGKKKSKAERDRQNAMSKGTLRKALHALENDKIIRVRPQPGHEFESAQYTLNIPYVQELEDNLPKNYLAIFGGVTNFECPPVTNFESGTSNGCNSPDETVVTPQLQILKPLIDKVIDTEQTNLDNESNAKSANAISPRTQQQKNEKFYQGIPMTYEEALAYLKPHGPHEGLDAVEVMSLARRLWVEAHEPMEDTNERSIDHLSGNSSHSLPRGVENSRAQDSRRSAGSHPASATSTGQLGDTSQTSERQQTPTLGPVPPCDETALTGPPIAGVPSASNGKVTQELHKNTEKGKLKAATPSGPPPEPESSAIWGTRKCLAWFDYWRGSRLIGTFKNSQAATCAKGLAEQYSEDTVLSIRDDMLADPYWIAQGGVDVCNVANNIAKYVRLREAKKRGVVAIAPSQQQPTPQKRRPGVNYSSFTDPNYNPEDFEKEFYHWEEAPWHQKEKAVL